MVIVDEYVAGLPVEVTEGSTHDAAESACLTEPPFACDETLIQIK